MQGPDIQGQLLSGALEREPVSRSSLDALLEFVFQLTIGQRRSASCTEAAPRQEPERGK